MHEIGDGVDIERTECAQKSVMDSADVLLTHGYSFLDRGPPSNLSGPKPGCVLGATKLTDPLKCYHDAMIRTQIQLTEEQAARLREVAAAEGRSMADVIRESVDSYLADAPLRRSDEALRADAIALAGKYESRLGDLAREHDRYFAEDLAR